MGSRMKDRTKVVIRHLPPTISQSTLMDQIDDRFSGRYNWVSFRPGNNSQKQQSYSRAYIDFQRPEDVIEFADFFGGHVFLNEKGTQFKTIVEYAPSQRVPRQGSKKDGREGTIHKDPDYLEFLEFIAKPVENLPSAEIQLERRDAERAGTVKDAPIVTPLMDFVRQKRAAKVGSRRSLPNGKATRRAIGISFGSPNSAVKRGSDKRRTSTATYVLKDTSRSSSVKDKSSYVMIPKRSNQQISEKSVSIAAAGTELSPERGLSGSADTGTKKILLLKEKEKKIPHESSGLALQQTAASPIRSPVVLNAPRQNQRRDATGRIIRSILLNKDSRQSSSAPPSGIPILATDQEKDKRPPRRSKVQLYDTDTNETPEDRVVGNDSHGFYTEKPEKRTWNKDRPDRGVWTPLCRSEGSHASDESLSSSTSQHKTSHLNTAEGTRDDTKNDMTSARSGEVKHFVSGRGGHMPVDNGPYKHNGRRVPSQNGKDADGSSKLGDGKPLKRGNFSGYGSQEKQVWVQKSSSGP